jgi:Arc/MetJ-type ribon-helix-helix transcriptional regulator
MQALERGFSNHMTVRIPRGMADAIEKFLQTEEAAHMGFDSKADVVTAAVRHLLMEFGYFKIPLQRAKPA